MATRALGTRESREAGKLASWWTPLSFVALLDLFVFSLSTVQLEGSLSRAFQGPLRTLLVSQQPSQRSGRSKRKRRRRRRGGISKGAFRASPLLTRPGRAKRLSGYLTVDGLRQQASGSCSSGISLAPTPRAIKTLPCPRLLLTVESAARVLDREPTVLFFQ